MAGGSADGAPPSSSSSTGVAARRDAPVFRPSHRGDITSALAASDTAESKAEALAAYEREKFCQSSTRDSLLHTWQRLHWKWFGPAVPVFPVTIHTIAAVLSMLKKGGYRTPANYISRLKSEHCKYEPWHPWLEEEASAGIRSVCRGLGPAKQSLPYPLDRAAEGAHHQDPPVPGAPLGFANLAVISCFFMLREIEATLMLVSSVTLNMAEATVTILLPITKTDWRALGCVRTWGCVCASFSASRCPFHAACCQMELLTRTFGPKMHAAGFPFFSTLEGLAADKSAVIECIEFVVQLLKMPLTGKDGRNLFGGHAFRVGGARHLCRHGVPVHTIALLARWSSDMVHHYLKDTPLEKLTAEYLKSASNPHGSQDDGIDASSGSKLKNTCRLTEAEQTMLKELTKKAEDQEEELRKINTNIEHIKSTIVEPMYVVSFGGLGSWHIMHPHVGVPSTEWKVKCGWRYGGSVISREAHFPKYIFFKRICDRCLPKERAVMKNKYAEKKAEEQDEAAEKLGSSDSDA